MHYKLCSLIGNQDALIKTFEILERIGEGGESLVYKIKHRESHRVFALVVDKELKQLMRLDQEKDVITTMMNNQKNNCHQMMIFDFFWITSKNLGVSKSSGQAKLVHVNRNVQPGDLLNRYYDNDATAQEFRHRVYIMELGACNLTEKTYAQLPDDKKTYDRLQMRICELSFKTAGINSTDNKLRNHVIMPSTEVVYGGKPMSNYDYWAYSLCYDLVIYIPKQEQVVKRIDFIDWRLGEKKQFTPEQYREYLKDFMPKDISWESLCTKPENDSILYVTLITKSNISESKCKM